MAANHYSSSSIASCSHSAVVQIAHAAWLVCTHVYLTCADLYLLCLARACLAARLSVTLVTLAEQLCWSRYLPLCVLVS
jgi:hypothetical protein